MKFGKLNLPIGKDKTNVFNLNSNVIATGEMGQLIPIRQIECVPGDKFTLDVAMFTRTAPLVCPTYGSVKFTTRAFFVPTRLIMAHFKEFITDKPVAIDGGYVDPTIPFIKNTELTEIFITNTNGLTVQVSQGGNCDLQVVNLSGGVVGYYNFTNKGRMWLKFLNGLGYRWNFIRTKSNPTSSDLENEVSYSLLPLFAFLRVYMDYYLPSQYLTGSEVKQFFDGYIDVMTSHDLMIERLYLVLNSIQLTYDNDYFTSAWRYPLSILEGANQNSISIPQSSNVHERSSSRLFAESTVDDTLGETGSGTASNFAVSLAVSLANYIIRNNYAGSRAVEQILARFGVKVPDYEFQRSVHFGTSVSNLQIMDVTNTAESENYKLGQFGAKAIGFDKGKKFHFECKEYGYILLLTSIMPETSIGWQGFDRNLMHLNRFDFFIPEFDGKFMQPIYSGELLSDYKGSHIDGDDEDYQDYADYNNKPRCIFGFVPTYSEYKCAKDNVIGDFNVPHLRAGLDCYHLFRDYYPTSNSVAQNPDIVYFNSEQYNRIFNVTDTNVDHFYMIYRIGVKAVRPMRTVSQAIPFDDNDIEHRNSVSVKSNGSSFNN